MMIYPSVAKFHAGLLCEHNSDNAYLAFIVDCRKPEDIDSMSMPRHHRYNLKNVDVYSLLVNQDSKRAGKIFCAQDPSTPITYIPDSD